MTRFLSASLVFALLWCCAARADDQQIIDELEAAWKGQRSEIATAHIRFRVVRTGYSSVRQLSPDELQKLLTSVDLAKKPDDLKKVADGVLKKHLSTNQPWGSFEFWCEGDRTRENVTGGRQPAEVHIRDQKTEVLTSFVNKQVSIYQLGAPHVFAHRLRHFRFIPGQDLTNFRVTRQTPQEVVLSDADSELVVDRATHLVTRHTMQSTSGDTHELWQGGAVHFPGDIVMPAWICDARFDRGLKTIGVIVIESAEFNRDVPAAVFALAAPKGTKVFDWREDIKRPRYLGLTKPESDVVREVDLRTSIATQFPQPPPDRGHYLWYGAILVVALLMVAGWGLRHRFT